MADFDDFEIVNETNFSTDPSFEIIDSNGQIEKTVTVEPLTTPDVVLPLLIPKPIRDKITPIIQQQTENLPVQSQEIIPPIVKKTTTSIPMETAPIKLAPVPPLPPSPPLQRYGAAAEIPHSLDMTGKINAIIDNAKKMHENTLAVATSQDKQQQDIQTILEQRRKLISN